MQKLFENWRKYITEARKQTEDVGYVLVDDDGDSVHITARGVEVNDISPLLGHIIVARFDGDDDEEDDTLECDNNLWWVLDAKAVGKGAGYGPLLYDLALEYINDQHRGVVMSGGHGETTGTVSADAAAVWQYYFDKRGDVNRRKDPRCSDILSQWIEEDPSLQKYHNALMHVYWKEETTALDELESTGKIEYR